MKVVQFHLEAGGSVLIEVDDSPHEDPVGRGQDVVNQVGVSFDRALGGVRSAAEAALGQFQQMTRRPDELEITFGVKLDAEMGAVIARTGIGGQLEVKLTWKADSSPES
jgi:hypothetical protein